MRTILPALARAIRGYWLRFQRSTVDPSAPHLHEIIVPLAEMEHGSVAPR